MKEQPLWVPLAEEDPSLRIQRQTANRRAESEAAKFRIIVGSLGIGALLVLTTVISRAGPAGL